MNIFATDHPLNCDSKDKLPGVRSCFFAMLLVSLIFSRFLAIYGWYSDQIGTGDTTPGANPPLPFWEALLGAALFCLIIACVVTALFALIARFADGQVSVVRLRHTS